LEARLLGSQSRLAKKKAAAKEKAIAREKARMEAIAVGDKLRQESPRLLNFYVAFDGDNVTSEFHDVVKGDVWDWLEEEGPEVLSWVLPIVGTSVPGYIDALPASEIKCLRENLLGMKRFRSTLRMCLECFDMHLAPDDSIEMDRRLVKLVRERSTTAQGMLLKGRILSSCESMGLTKLSTNIKMAFTFEKDDLTK
jgi:hypothetical protein